MPKTALITPLALALAAIALPARAGFVDETAPPPRPLFAPVAQGVGQAPRPMVLRIRPVLTGADVAGWNTPAPALNGKTDDLLTAIVQLLPNDQQGLRLAVVGVDTTVRVSWMPGMTRRQALESILFTHHLRAEIKDGELRVNRALPLFAPAPMPQNAGAPAPLVPARPKPVWTLHAGTTVKMALYQWARSKQPAWTVVWPESVPDYPVVANTSYDQPELVDAVKSLFADLQSQGVHLEASVYTNHVITVGVQHAH